MAPASRASRKWILAAAVWLVAFGLLLFRLDYFLDDHFYRISAGRQILVYGDRPFADFRDPGYFLTLYVSAVAQAASGGGLFGEALVTCAAIATAIALTFWLAESASGSLVIGVTAAYMTMILPPRYYDYDKVLFYLAGMLTAWRYADLPTRGRVLAAGAVTAVATLFRYDNGLFVLAACLAVILVRWRRTPARAVSDAAVYLGSVVAFVAPALIFVHATAGLPEAFRQITTYAAQEGQRTQLFKLPPLGVNLVSIAYLLAVAAVPLAVVQLTRSADDVERPLQFASAKILAAVVLLLCVVIFILRNPIDARIGSAVPVAAVVGAWIVGQWVWDYRAGAGVGRRSIRPATAIALGAAAVAVIVAQTGWQRVFDSPVRIPERFHEIARTLGTPAPGTPYFPDHGAVAGMIRYLIACTPADARVLVASFTPQAYFFSQRGFGGGMGVVFGSHWSSAADQQRTIEQLETQRVPIVVTQTHSDELNAFPRLVAYLKERYQEGGTTNFEDSEIDPDAFRVLIRRDLGTIAVNARWRLPCAIR